MEEHVGRLKQRMAEIGHLHSAMSVLDWDLQTYMPPGGSRARSEQLGYLSGLAHERFISPDTGALLEASEEEARELDADSDESRLTACVRRDYDHAVKIPSNLAAELAQHVAVSQEIWRTARERSDFPTFAPSLTKTLELTRRVADLLG